MIKRVKRKYGSSGFVFICCRQDEIADIAREGLVVNPEDQVLSLREARARSTEAILVAEPRDGIPGMKHHFSPAEILNADPYRPPRPMVAGGGVLVRQVRGGPQVLLILRRGVWDLPKGKQDRGESIAACAVREVNEELGIFDASVIRPLGLTRHGYADGKWYTVKTTHWYLMRSMAERFVPQAEEQIEAVAWMVPNDAVKHLAFPALRTLIERNALVLAQESP